MSQIKNWRPISLLSYFYKINSKAMNKRLAKVIDKLTYLNQKACNKIHTGGANRYSQNDSAMRGK